MRRKCPSCGKWARSEWWVCPKCGRRLLDERDPFAGPGLRWYAKPGTVVFATVAVIAIVFGLLYAVPRAPHILDPFRAQTASEQPSIAAEPETTIDMTLAAVPATTPSTTEATTTTTTEASTTTTTSGFAPARLLGVVDGDTITVKLENGKQERVALIGVLAPQIKRKGGTQSKEHLQQLLAAGPVSLEYDKVTRDKYGRLLAYVHAGSVFVNEQIIRDGFAKARTTGDNQKYGDLFAEAQQAAEKAGAGTWGT